MANDVIEADITANNNRQRELGTVWTSSTVGYFFFISGVASQLKYRKTTDAGSTWDAAVTIHSDSTGVFALWADWWTGGSGTLIHMTYGDRTAAPDEAHYVSLDTATDTLSGLVVVVTGISITQASAYEVSITKARGGNLYIGGQWGSSNDVTNRGFWRSIDNGATWTEVADVMEVSVGASDHLALFPGNEADNQDIWCLFLDQSALTISLKVYDDSGDSWSETAIVVLTNHDDNRKIMAGVVRLSDNHLFLVHFMRRHEDAVNNDLRFWEINGAASITERTVVDTQDDFVGVTLMYDHQAGRLYSIYIRTHGDATFARIWYATSDNGGVTWAAPIQFSDIPGTQEEIVNVSHAQVIISPGGRLAPIWVDNWDDDMMANEANSIALLPVPPPPPPSSATPRAMHSPGGSFNRVLSGGAGGFISYITPDGREYPLHTPHQFGRWVVSFTGFGTPPIDYITQRGPFQHGVTVKDFFLRPRAIQLLIRQAFCDRTAWWAGRAALLNEIRPNRQATATATVPGILRIVETDGTIRDLSVFITEGPRFEPRVSGEWDEWAFMEVLRFIAHDPVAFDPTEVTATFAIVLAASLVFPITFPITFGSGVVDDTLVIAYPGTWLTFPVITIVGPIELPRIDNNTTGEKIEFTIDIAPGRTITIDLTEGNKTVVDDLGINLIGAITPDSDLGTFHIAPDPEAPGGINTLRLRGDNPTGATSVSLAYFERYFGF